MNIPLLSIPVTAAADIPSVMDNAAIPFASVRCVNWDEYPFCPEAAVRLALTDDALLIHYRVSEPAVLARFTADGDRVWTDSCMECFLLCPDGKNYYNIESSCIGTVLVARGTGRGDRIPLSADRLITIDRYATLGRAPFGLIDKPTTWELALVIPRAIFGDDKALFLSPVIRANIYKCGDDLPTPHFVSLFPINIPEPDFHRPDFFGELKVTKP